MAKKETKKVKLIFNLPPKTKKIVIPLLITIVLGFGLYFGRSLFVVAMVNNTPITRWSFDRTLEKQAGKQILENEITRILIMQEAKKQNIVIADSEIDAKITEIEKQLEAQGANLDTLLTSQGQTRKDLRAQLEVQIAVEKIIGRDIEITDQELEDYYNQNKSYYAKDATFESLKESIRSEVINTKMSEKFQPWIDELKKNSKINYFLNL